MPDRTVIQPTQARTKPQVPAAEPCDVCGGPTLEIKCKIICRNCGYTRDCSDP